MEKKGKEKKNEQDKKEKKDNNEKMKDKKEKDQDKKEKGQEKKEEKPVLSEKDKKRESFIASVNEIRANIVIIEKAVATKEKELLSRVIRFTSPLLKKISADILIVCIEQHFPLKDEHRLMLLKYLHSFKESSMTDDNDHFKLSDKELHAASVAPIPEVEVYLHLLSTIFLVNHKFYEASLSCSTALINRIAQFNRRTLDQFYAKALFNFSLSHEKLGTFKDIRQRLILTHRTACLRHDVPSQFMLVNLILRNYLHYNLYTQADKFRLNTNCPDSHDNNQLTRYLYYTGKINAVQLDYSTALANLTQAIRKAPQHTAIGFRQQTYKLYIIVQLLMGEIPERSIFRLPDLRRSLKPYLELTQTVRIVVGYSDLIQIGDVAAFSRVLNRWESTFKKDKTLTLIFRLRHNVIKTGLRKINLSYSRISLKDICEKLNLGSLADTEHIIAKAISDGVIDATINKEAKYVCAKDISDIYSTTEPHSAFHKRIKFCMDLRNEVIQAMQYPDRDGTSFGETDDEKTLRQKQEDLLKLLTSMDEEE